MAQSSIHQSTNEWISNHGHFDLGYYTKNIIENYFSLLGNHLKEPFNIVLAIGTLILGIFSKNIKKITPFYIIFLGIPFSLFMLDCYFQTRTSCMIRYCYASLPAVFMIYGLSFANRTKINFIFLTILFLLPIVLPQFKNWKNLHYIQNEAIDFAQTSSQFTFDKKKVLIVNHMMAMDSIIFCKYLVERLDKQPAIFNQETQREIYITATPKVKIEEIMNFIKDKNIQLVIFLDHDLILKGNEFSESYHHLKSENLAILEKELSKLNDIEFKIVKNLDK